MSNKKVIQISQHKNTMQLTWVINNICTNSCDYCPPTLYSGSNHHYEWDKAKLFIDRLLKRYSNICCSISGGEPTLSPFFPELVKKFYDNGHSVSITSNGVRSLRYWEEISPFLSNICFSYHPQFDDKFLLEKAIAASHHTHVAIRVMMYDNYWDQCIEKYNEFSKCESITVEPVRILSEMAARHIGNSYSPEQEAWLESNPKSFPRYKLYESKKTYRPGQLKSKYFYDDGSIDMLGDSNYLINSNQNDFRGWACNIGLESLFIHFDGWVKKGNCLQGGNLFHLNDHENYDLPTTGELCFQSICHCGTDVNIGKVPILNKEHPFIKSNENLRSNINEDPMIFKNMKKKFKKTFKIIPEQL